MPRVFSTAVYKLSLLLRLIRLVNAKWKVPMVNVEPLPVSRRETFRVLKK